MKKRLFAMICIAVVLGTGITVPVSAEEKNDQLKKILDTIQSDYDSAAESMEKGNTDLQNAIGDSYDTYVQNSSKVSEWMESLANTCTALYEKIDSSSKSYYKALTENVDMSDSSAWNDAVDDLYDLVYDDILDDLYDDVYDGYLDDLYDLVYDDILDEQPEGTEYEDWYDTRSEFYSLWSEARSDVYSDWSDARSDCYNMFSDIKSAFYSGEYNVEDIIGEKIDAKLEKMITGMEKAFSDQKKSIGKSLKTVEKSLGTDLTVYEDNYSDLKDWYETVNDQSQELYDTIADESVEYYKTVVTVCDMDKPYEWKRAINVLYRRIYKDAYSDYLKTEYKKQFNALLTKYYKTFLKENKDSVEYSDWYDLRSDFYEDWYDARSDFYEDWYDARSDFYEDWYDISSAFYSGDTDVSDILHVKED